MSIFLTLFLLWLIGAVISQIARYILLNSERLTGYSFLPPTVAVIRLTGIIADSSPSPFSEGFINWRSFRQSFARAASLPNLKAIVLEINSPGGSPVQCSLFVKRLAQLKLELQKQTNKKVDFICFVEDICASGGYFIACGCDHIVCDESSLVGSIGVINSGFGFDGLIDKAGVKRRVYTAGTSKSFLDPFKPEKPEDIALLEQILSSLHDNFKDVVSTSRSTKLDDANKQEIFSGAIFDGRTALKLGLVDELGERVTWCRNAFGENINFVEIKKRPNFFEAFAEMRSNAFEASSMMSLFRNISLLSALGFGDSLVNDMQMSENVLKNVEAKLKTNPVMAISNTAFSQFNF